MKLYLLTTLVFLICHISETICQVKTKNNPTITNSLSSLSLDLDSNNIIFNFIWFEDYQNGLGKFGGNFSSKGQVTSNTNWKLSCKAKGKFTHFNGINKMPLNNLGVSIDYKGERKVINRTLSSPLPLARKNKTLLFTTERNKPNKKGNSKDKNNSFGHNRHHKKEVEDFIIYWEMGTRKGKMNKKSIIEQKLKRGSYSVDIKILLSEKL